MSTYIGTIPSFAWKNTDSSTIQGKVVSIHILKICISLYGQNLNSLTDSFIMSQGHLLSFLVGYFLKLIQNRAPFPKITSDRLLEWEKI